MEIRKNNSELKPYVENFIIEKLENCELFVKTYGKGFARERLRTNFKKLYTDELNEKSSGQYSFDFKTITLFSKGEDGNLLTSNDIKQDDDLQATTVHEGVHAVFNKTKKECKALKIQKGSGFHYIFNNKNELGRGLNEGFTNWVCIKAGMNERSYRELTNIVNLLEIALGEEKVMQFGKGDIEHNLSSLLNMTTEECVNFLTKCDSIYNYNDKASDYRIAVALLSKEIEDKEENPDDEKQTNNELNNNYLYRTLSKNSEYLQFTQIHNLNPKSEESKLKFFQQKYAFYKEQSQKMERETHAIIVSKYFIKELDELLNKESCTFKEYIKFDNLPLFLRSSLDSDNEILKQFNEKQKLLKEKFEEKTMNDFKSSLEQGEMLVEELAICNYFLRNNGYNSLKEFQKYISEKMLPENPELYERFLGLIEWQGAIRNIFDYKFFELETETGKKKALFFDERQGYHFTRNLNEIKTIQANEELENAEDLFNITLEFSQDFQEIISNFMKLKESINQKNPNSKIQIVNNVIIVNDDKNEMSYYVIEGNDFALAQAKEILPESRKTIKVIRPQEPQKIDSKDNENKQEQENGIRLNATKNTSLIPISQNPFRRFLENIKAKVINVFSKNHQSEEENQIGEDLQSKTDDYTTRKEEFNNRIQVDTNGKYNPEQHVQENTSKGKNIDYTK